MSASRLTAAPLRTYQLPPPQPSPPLQHQSPQAQQSPSTVEASPLPTPVPPNFNGHVEAIGRSIAEKGRAQIACTSCRRNKTRCRNKNDGSACEACAERDKPCDYQTASTAGSYVGNRRESTVGEVDSSVRKRKRTLAPTSRAVHSPYDVVRVHEDVLESPLLTPKVWEELFDIYERHFAADFPFLHRRRFLQPFRQAAPIDSPAMNKGSAPVPRPRRPYTPPLLLAFLTQTARYHPILASREDSDPIAAARFWAHATEERLGPTMGEPSLENAQALLFLGFHWWSDLKGQKGWLLMASAINYTRISRYEYAKARREHAKADKEKRRKSREQGRVLDCDDEFVQQEHFIDREIHRRTFWSGFILDQYLSCGKERPRFFTSACHIPLPCSDAAFSYGQKVRTRRLGEDDEEYAKRRRDREHAKIWHQDDSAQVKVDKVDEELDGEWEVGRDESELSLYIQAADLFGRILEWSNDGGRRREDFPPWNEQCGFRKLEVENQKLQAALPKHLVLTPRNTNTHITYKTSRNYILIHALHSLCTIALYREYMAFKPWGRKKPEGPLDEPKITEELPTDQPDYWITQARRCFGAAKDLADLLKACQSADALVDNPITGWATYIVIWCAIYCHFFPRMDPDGALDSRIKPIARDLLDIIIDRQNRLTMACQWGHILVNLNTYFKAERVRWISLGGSPGSTISDSGGGLLEYSKSFEAEHKEFGSLVDKSWNHKPIKRGDLELVHYLESEDGGEVANPTTFYKKENTPVWMSAPAFTPVNSTGRANSTSETPAPSPQSHMSHAVDPLSSAGSEHTARAYHAPYDTHRVQSVVPPLAESVATSPTYDSGVGSYTSLTQANRDPYRFQNSATDNGVVSVSPPRIYEEQQPVEDAAGTLEQMQQTGQYGLDTGDLNSFQRATSIFGYAGDFDLEYDSRWFPHFQQSHVGPFYGVSTGTNDPETNGGKEA